MRKASPKLKTTRPAAGASKVGIINRRFLKVKREAILVVSEFGFLYRNLLAANQVRHYQPPLIPQKIHHRNFASLPAGVYSFAP